MSISFLPRALIFRPVAFSLAMALTPLVSSPAWAQASAIDHPDQGRTARETVYQVLSYTTPAAQPGAEREAVRRAVLDYVEGFYEGDTVKLARAMWPEVRKYGYAHDQASGAYRGMAMQYPSGFMNFANGVRAGRTKTPPNAPKDITIFDVQDQTASAKLVAWWGTDYLLLAKEQGRWMITHVLWQSLPPRRSP